MLFKDLLKTSYFFAFLLSCMVSLLFIRYKNKPAYMQSFFWYPTIAFLVVLSSYLSYSNDWYNQYVSEKTKIIVDNLSLILHYILLGLFIKQNISTSTKNKLLTILFVGFLFIIIISVFSKELYTKNGLAYGITNSSLIIFCIIYYHKLFNSPPTIILLHSPAFWIINGVFFGMAATIPINFSGHFFTREGNEEGIQVIKKFSYISYIIMHLFFIKAYLCIIRPHKVF